jgi:hypothetical protein
MLSQNIPEDEIVVGIDCTNHRKLRARLLECLIPPTTQSTALVCCTASSAALLVQVVKVKTSTAGTRALHVQTQLLCYTQLEPQLVAHPPPKNKQYAVALLVQLVTFSATELISANKLVASPAANSVRRSLTLTPAGVLYDC